MSGFWVSEDVIYSFTENGFNIDLWWSCQDTTALREPPGMKKPHNSSHETEEKYSRNLKAGGDRTLNCKHKVGDGNLLHTEAISVHAVYTDCRPRLEEANKLTAL